MGNKEWDEVPRSMAREGGFCLNSLKIKRARWVVRLTAIYTVEENWSDGLELAPGIMRDTPGSSALLPSELRIASLAMNKG
jgi:hypothetical protein